MSVDDRKKLIDALLPYVKRLARADEQHLYLLQLADTTHVTVEVLKQMMGTNTGQPRAVVGAPRSGEAAQRAVPTVTNENPTTRATAFLFAHALSDESMTSIILEKFAGKSLPEPWGKLYEALREVYTPSQLSASLAGKEQTLFLRLRTYLDRTAPGTYNDAIDRAVLAYDEIIVGLSQSQKQEEARRQLLLLARSRMEEQKKSLEAAIRQAEASGDSSLLTSLIAEYTALISEFRKVN